ncbi:MAG TPA: enoyl-CoA hydratase/isomerase family protein [Paralcaligenes sp.]|jgi:enoyl-CoA hydratase/carnithine racemase
MSDVLVRNEGEVTIISINRPGKLNALSNGVAHGLEAAFKEFDESDQKVAILAGEGKSFTAGADINDFPEFWRCVPTVGITTQKPVIAAVQGWCVGGGVVMAAMADLCVCAENTTFWYPEGKLGVSGGMICTLAARMPHKAAMEIMYLARKINARRAYEMGLVNEVVPDGEQLNAALKMANELVALAPLVLRGIKRIVNDQILTKGPSETAAILTRDMQAMNNSVDFKEGKQAFAEKRQPKFVGR